MKKQVLIIIFLILAIIKTSVTVHAKSITSIPDFNGLSGTTKSRYLGDLYRNNYYLDIEKTGILETGDKIINDIANVIFTLVKTLGYLVCCIFYHAMTFDIANLFGSEISAIQAALHNDIFNTFFILAFCGTAYALAVKFSKRDLSGSVGDIAKVVIIMLFSALIVKHSAAALSATTNITKSISVGALTSINNTGNTSSYAADAAGLLWVSLVHEPFVSLEFNENAVGDSTVESILTLAPGSAAREAKVKEMRNSDDSLFSKTSGAGRLGFLIVYLIPFLIKSVIFIIAAILQIAFQVLAVLYMFLAPVVLLLALLPSFGGIDVISAWLKKIFETQLNMLIITFVIGLLIKLTSALYSLSGVYGWFVVIFLETVISLVTILAREQIFKGLSTLNKTMQRPATLKYQLARTGNVFGALGSNAYNLSKKRSKAMHFSHSANRATTASARDKSDVTDTSPKITKQRQDQEPDPHSGQQNDNTSKKESSNSQRALMYKDKNYDVLLIPRPRTKQQNKLQTVERPIETVGTAAAHQQDKPTTKTITTSQEPPQILERPVASVGATAVHQQDKQSITPDKTIAVHKERTQTLERPITPIRAGTVHKQDRPTITTTKTTAASQEPPQSVERSASSVGAVAAHQNDKPPITPTKTTAASQEPPRSVERPASSVGAAAAHQNDKPPITPTKTTAMHQEPPRSVERPASSVGAAAVHQVEYQNDKQPTTNTKPNTKTNEKNKSSSHIEEQNRKKRQRAGKKTVQSS